MIILNDNYELSLVIYEAKMQIKNLEYCLVKFSTFK
ncbi:hypothetical protein BD847_3123 [Flavobacterium cutihirudinis]|uniref:Uncharacterized protein n=1 Tax=Flavobacterium cutihirudinis TaxID=1265740 RepID=A0A3D9FPW2_9FLAO|nr:hypothetical protein BD847_3123 [Flavobacterium cutihirudinis]